MTAQEIDHQAQELVGEEPQLDKEHVLVGGDGGEGHSNQGVGLWGDRNRDDQGTGHHEQEGVGGDGQPDKVQGVQVLHGTIHPGGPSLHGEGPERDRNRVDQGASLLEQPRRLTLNWMRERAAAKELLDKAAAKESLEKRERDKSLKRSRKISQKITKFNSLTGTGSQPSPRNRKRKQEHHGDGDSEAVQARKLPRNSEGGSERVYKTCNNSKITYHFNSRVADQSATLLLKW